MAWPQIFRPDNMTLGNEVYVLGPFLVLAQSKYALKYILDFSQSHTVIAKWGQIYFTYFHLIFQICCLGVFQQKYDKFYVGLRIEASPGL